MDTSYTPSAKLSAADPAMRDGPATNAPIEREALDNRRHLRGATWGLFEWSGEFRVAGASNTDFHVYVGVILAVTLRDSGGDWRPYFTSTEQDLTLAHVEGAPASLASDTHYYAYVYSDGTTTPRFQLSTSPPTEAGAPTLNTGYKRGQTANYRYIGTFRTDGSGVPLACRATRGRYTYQQPASLATITSSGAQSLASRIPPHARTALLRATATRSSTTGDLVAVVRETSGGGVSEHAWGVSMYGADVLTSVSGSFEIVPNAAREVYVQSGGADSAVVLTVAGFTE